MTDIADQSASAEALALSIALSSRRHEPAVKTSETCLNCGEKTTKGARWCDHECLKDWEKRHDR